MTTEAIDQDVVLQRVIFPEHGDPKALPLYLDPEVWSWEHLPEDADDHLARIRGVFNPDSRRRPVRITERGGLAWLRGRRGIEVPPDTSVSLGTYFNAFPASYWAKWTTVSAVRLRVTTSGSGRIIVYRSNARGVVQRVDGREVDGTATTEFLIPFVSFLDGGWLWFDLVTDDSRLSLVEAAWLAPEGTPRARVGSATLAITTLNRGAYCSALLSKLGTDPDALAALDRVRVVDQGSERLSEHPGFAAAESALGDRLEVIVQANLGGSGGFSRGMYEAVREGSSDYIILLDDDVEIEPESLRRAVMFADFSAAPTIVGGHMLDMYDKSKLHAFAEGIRWRPFMWGPFTPDRHDFGESNLRQTAWLHRRYDVDYNGWWMSLIPLDIVREIGLSLPVFIKWDDAEYSLRARAAGHGTVSLPGAAVWHVSWVDKDDSHDWQAFFHARNRLVAALLHSPHERGGSLWRANLAMDVKNLLTMDYYTVAMRHAAIRSVLDGPRRLHADMRTRLARVRAMGADFTEARLLKADADLPHFPAHEVMHVLTGRSDPGPSGWRLRIWLAKQFLRHAATSPDEVAKQRPLAHLAHQDARWFVVPNHDSVLVSNAEGSGATWHLRDPKRFRRMLVDAVRLNLAYRRRWPKLARAYRAALPEITSMKTWEKTVHADGK